MFCTTKFGLERLSNHFANIYILFEVVTNSEPNSVRIAAGKRYDQIRIFLTVRLFPLFFVLCEKDKWLERLDNFLLTKLRKGIS